MMKKTIPLLWLFLFIATTTAQEFEPPVIIDPPNPQVGDIIRIGVFELFYPPCLVLPMQNIEGDTHLFEYIDNHINLTVVTDRPPFICNPIPVSPAPREYYELGVLEEGDYSLQVFSVSFVVPLPAPPNTFPALFGNEINFSVHTPKIINNHTPVGLFIFILLFILIPVIISKKSQY